MSAVGPKPSTIVSSFKRGATRSSVSRQLLCVPYDEEHKTQQVKAFADSPPGIYHSRHSHGPYQRGNQPSTNGASLHSEHKESCHDPAVFQLQAQRKPMVPSGFHATGAQNKPQGKRSLIARTDKASLWLFSLSDSTIHVLIQQATLLRHHRSRLPVSWLTTW